MPKAGYPINWSPDGLSWWGDGLLLGWLPRGCHRVPSWVHGGGFGGAFHFRNKDEGESTPIRVNQGEGIMVPLVDRPWRGVAHVAALPTPTTTILTSSEQI